METLLNIIKENVLAGRKVEVKFNKESSLVFQVYAPTDNTLYGYLFGYLDVYENKEGKVEIKDPFGKIFIINSYKEFIEIVYEYYKKYRVGDFWQNISQDKTYKNDFIKFNFI